MDNPTGIVFNIQRYSIHDGPGIRTVVFLKGCPLHCLWCSNPESQSLLSEISYNERLCTGCQSCINACPKKALSFDGNTVHVDRTRCAGCGKCEHACVFRAIKLEGKAMSVSEVLDIVGRDRIFYDKSNGGVTVSGGDPFMQKDFTLPLLKALAAQGIHTAAETCGMVPYETLAGSRTDLFLYDLKHINDEMHVRCTGVSNKMILDNLQQLIADDRNVIVRIPLIPEVNMDDKTLTAYGRYLRGIGAVHVNLLPYHRLGLAKYKTLGLEYSMEQTMPPSEDQIDHALALLGEFGINVQRS